MGDGGVFQRRNLREDVVFLEYPLYGVVVGLEMAGLA